MATHYLQQLSFHKLGNHQPNASLHSFVLVRNSLLHSILAQQQQDSWLDACFDELTPTNVPSSEPEGMDISLLEEDDEDDEDDDDEPVSPDQVDFAYSSDDPPGFFMPIDNVYADPPNEPHHAKDPAL